MTKKGTDRAPVVGVILKAGIGVPDYLPPYLHKLWKCRQIVALSVPCPTCGARRRQRCEADAVGNRYAHGKRILAGIEHAGADHLTKVGIRADGPTGDHPADEA